MAKRLMMDQFILRCKMDKDKDGPLTQISLVYMKGMASEELHSIRYSAGGGQEPKEDAEVFSGRADGYVQDMPGEHSFYLWAFFGGRKEKQDQYLFTKRVTRDTDGDGSLSTESPTPQGQTQQDMRHKEVVFQQMLSKQTHLDTTLMQLNGMLITQLHGVREESFQAFTLVKQMLLEKIQDNNAARMAQLQYERDTEMRNTVMRLAPALANNILGKNVFPQNTEDTSIVEGIAEHLISAKADQSSITTMLGAFPQELQAVVMSRIQRYAQAKLDAKERAEQARQLHPASNGVADAKGE